MSSRRTVVVCGGRDYWHHAHISKVLGKLHAEHPIDEIVCGGASGADASAVSWAKHHEVDVRIFRAKWKKFGLAAGPKRNALMLDVAKPSLVIAFPGGAGTADMIKRAKEAGVEVLEVP